MKGRDYNKNFINWRTKSSYRGKWVVFITNRDGKYVTHATFNTRKAAQRYATGVNKSGLVARVIEQW